MSEETNLSQQAMDEQAKRIAISFIDYAWNHYCKLENSWYNESGVYTTEQLYDKFLFEVMARLEEDT